MDADVSREINAFISKEKSRSRAKPTTQYSVLEGWIPYLESLKGKYFMST